IEGKGATYYGIGSAIARIVEVILGNQRSMLTVCTPVPEVAGVSDVTVSLPQLVGGEGIIHTLSLPLAAEDQDLLHKSAAVVKAAIDELGDV
ncbi:MAG: hypothetical protein JXB38_13145, partial [Anaerolineales bacterium]|nr:hypothetical protein [Anaerolineales bacterium]